MTLGGTPPGPSTRFVVLVAAPRQSGWSERIAAWARRGAAPIEAVICTSSDVVRTQLEGVRPFSALLLDAALAGLDRDLVQAAARTGAAVIVVGARGAMRFDGIAAQARRDIDAAGLTELLGRCAAPITAPVAPPWAAPAHVRSNGLLIAVTGPGGTGASTVAIDLADAFGSRGPAVLVDCCLNAEQAMLHGEPHSPHGITELVAACRSRYPAATETRSFALDSATRHYDLVTGVDDSTRWTSIRPLALEVALHALRDAYATVVADIDADFEGEDGGGSVDVEERHALARIPLAQADAVVVVGTADRKGLFSLARVVDACLAFGVPRARVVPVLNRAPRGLRARAQIAASWLPVFGGSAVRAAATTAALLRAPEGIEPAPVTVRPGTLGLAAVP